MTPPPEHLHLNDEAYACWYRVQSRLIAMGEWESHYVPGLELAARQCAFYLSFAREARALKDVEPGALKEIESSVEDTRRTARIILAEFLMIHRDRIALAAMNDEGLDTDIAALCAPWNGCIE